MSFKNLLKLAVLSSSLLTVVSCGTSSFYQETQVNIAGKEYTMEVNKLVIGMECDYAPFNWTDESSNSTNTKITNSAGYTDGYDVQIAKKIGEIMNIEVEFMKLEWDSLIVDCQNDSINMVLAGMTDTEERRKSIDFTDEYYRSEVVLITSKTIADQYSGQTLDATGLSTLLSGKKVISQANTVEDEMIDNFVSNYGCTHASANETFGGAAYDVSQGIADVLTVELPVAQTYVKQMSNLGIIHMNQDILGVDLSELGVSIGIKKGNDGLKTALNAALNEISKEDRNTMMTSAVERSGSN